MKQLMLRALIILPILLAASTACGQSSSLGNRAAEKTAQQEAADVDLGRESSTLQGNPVLEANSLIAIPVSPPKEFQIHDIVTIIVRQQKTWESDADMESRRRFGVESELEAFVKFTGGGIGESLFRRGKPNIEYDLNTRVSNEGDATREDRFVTRISGKIIDVKPNGNLVIEAKGSIEHDEDTSVVRLTGTVRSTDVTPDNTVLSTQVADLAIAVENTGSVRDAAARGWVTKLLDWLKPV